MTSLFPSRTSQMRGMAGVEKLRGPDTVRAQLKIEDPNEVAEGRLAEAVRAMPAGNSSSAAVALPSSPAPTTTATLSLAPPNEAMTISQPSTYNGRPDTF